MKGLREELLHQFGPQKLDRYDCWPDYNVDDTAASAPRSAGCSALLLSSCYEAAGWLPHHAAEQAWLHFALHAQTLTLLYIWTVHGLLFCHR